MKFHNVKQLCEGAHPDLPVSTTQPRAIALAAVAAALLLLPSTLAAADSATARVNSDSHSALARLLAVPAEHMTKIDIAEMNLSCAEGLPGATGLDAKACLSQLDAWAKGVRAETERHHYRFKRNPVEFENSEGFYRMLMMAVVLAEDFRVQYRSEKRQDPALAKAGDGFFADSRDVFLHGLLGPERRGTCSSLPVLYVAVGQRLGYPLKLVTTKGHLFVRWEGQGERFNVEAAGNGLSRFDDSYYRRWPYPVSDGELAAEGYLKSLTPAEELAVFLSIRGLCLREAGRQGEAAETFAAAARLAPHCLGYKALERSCREKVAGSDRSKTNTETTNEGPKP